MKEDLLERLERENIKIASFSKRVIAYVIDHFIITCIVFIIFNEQFANAADAPEIVRILSNFWLGFLLLQFSYHAIFTYFYGASLGKMACKILILDEELLDRPTLVQSCLRSAMRYLSNMAFFLGLVWALGNAYCKTWQDYVARTIVVDVA